MPTIEQLETLLTLDPNDPFVHYGLAQEYAKADEHERAIGSYDKVIELDSGYCYAYFFKSQSLKALGRNDEAQSTVLEGIEHARKAQDSKAESELRGLLD